MGAAIVAMATYMMHGFNDFTPFWYMTFLMIVRGAGQGLALMPAMNAGMNAVPPRIAGRASATMNQVRQVSVAFGIALLTTIMQSRQVFHASRLAASANMSTSNAILAMKVNMQSVAYQFGLSASLSRALGLGLTWYKLELLSEIQAINDDFIITAAVCACCVILGFFLVDGKKRRSVPVRTESTKQENIALEGRSCIV